MPQEILHYTTESYSAERGGVVNFAKFNLPNPQFNLFLKFTVRTIRKNLIKTNMIKLWEAF
jgi:hypothetical protein